MNSARRPKYQLVVFFWLFAEASIMLAVEKEFLKPKIVIILTNAKLLFPSSIRAEHNRAERQIFFLKFRGK